MDYLHSQFMASTTFRPNSIILIILTIIVSISSNLDTICTLYKLSKDNKHLGDCCSSYSLGSRHNLCERCKTHNVEPNFVNSRAINSNAIEYNFVLGIIVQMASKNDKTADMNLMVMDQICPNAIDASLDTSYFSQIPTHNDLTTVIVNTVNLFSKNKPCTILNKLEYDDLATNEDKLKLLLDQILYQIYNGIPYCELGNSIEIEEVTLKSLQVMGAIDDKTKNSSNEIVPKSYKPGYKAWIATVIAILVISIISVAMIVIVGMKKNITVYRFMLQIFVASAVSALITDSLLHLYPHSLGVGHDHDHHTEDESIYSSSNQIWKGIIIVATIYSFYLIEYLMLVLPKIFGKTGDHHHHHHHDHFHQSNKSKNLQNEATTYDSISKNIDGNVTKSPNIACNIVCHVDDHIAQHRLHTGVPMDCVEHIQEVHASEMYDSSVHSEYEGNTIDNNQEKSPQVNNMIVVGYDHENLDEQQVNTMSQKSPVFIQPKTTKLSFVSKLMKIDKVVWMLTLGDALHNCIDGLIIGTQFADEWPKGLSKGIMTSIAILCHEVPHEVGDYAAMLASGLSVKKAILLNVLTTITCFIGGFIGCGMSTTINTMWVEPIVAGIFIYIALTILMPSLIKSLSNAEKPFQIFLCHTFGYFFGSFCLIVISFHEDSIIPH